MHSAQRRSRPGQAEVLPCPHGGRAGKAFDAYVNKRMAQTIEDSGPIWFHEGDETLAGRLDAAKSKRTRDYAADNLDTSHYSKKELKSLKTNKPLEWAGYVRLSQLGYDQTLLREDRGASANIDIIVKVGSFGLYYDLKTIEGGTGAIRRRLSEGYDKWVRLSAPGAVVPRDIDARDLGFPRMIVDNRYSKVTAAQAREKIAECMRVLSEKGPFPHAETVLIKKDGTDEVIRT